MEVQVSVEGFVWQARVARAPSPANCVQQMAFRASTDILSNLARMQRALHIGCHHSIHLEVEELSPLQDMAALASFMPHADFSQDSCRGKVVSEMARENPVQLKSLESILHHRPGRFRGIASPPMRDTNPEAK